MHEILREDASYKGSLPSFGYALPSPVASTTIRNSMASIIDEVKKQRMDIVRLNNELRNSKGILDSRVSEEVRSRSEIAQLIRTLQREKECLLAEVRELKSVVEQSDSRAREKDAAVGELRAKNAQYLRQMGEQQSEVDSLRFSVTKMEIEAQERHSDAHKLVQKEMLDESEAQLRSCGEKYKHEAQKCAKLALELEHASTNVELLTRENEALAEKLEQCMRESGKLKQQLDEAEASAQGELGAELLADYHMMKKLRDEMDFMLQQINSPDF